MLPRAILRKAKEWYFLRTGVKREEDMDRGLVRKLKVEVKKEYEKGRVMLNLSEVEHEETF